MGLEKLLWTVIIEPFVVIVGVLFLLAVLFIVVASIAYPLMIAFDFIYGKIKKRWYREYYSLQESNNKRSKFLYNRLFRERTLL